MANNKLIVAAAGSGKTTHVVNEALRIKGNNVLITTFTEANEAEIKRKILQNNKCIPANVTVQTWFSFLIQHGAKPFRKQFFDHEIHGLFLASGQSTLYVKESSTKRYYFTEGAKIYSDKLTRFVLKCNSSSNGAVLDRLARIYSHIFIDEVQDLAGYDLDFLRALFSSNINMLLVGDPRQATYSTNNAKKNSRFARSKIISFFDDKSITITRDESSLVVNYRSVAPICDFSNKLFPNLPRVTSGNTATPEHVGVFLVKPRDVDCYLKAYAPIQLRYDKKTQTSSSYPARNFGESKGLSFDRVLIYPLKAFLEWMKDNNSTLAPTSRSKYYVAITRARYSVGIVCDYDDNTNIPGTHKYVP